MSEKLSCNDCQYHYIDTQRRSSVCNAFHQHFNPLECGDYTKISNKEPVLSPGAASARMLFQQAMEVMDDLTIKALGVPPSAVRPPGEELPNCRSNLNLNLGDRAAMREYWDAEIIDAFITRENRERNDRLRDMAATMAREKRYPRSEYEAIPRRKGNPVISQAVLESCQQNLDNPNHYQVGHQIRLMIRVVKNPPAIAFEFNSNPPNVLGSFQDIEVVFYCDYHPNRANEKVWIYNGPTFIER